MRNTNRLIDDFKYLTRSAIWKHLDAMAANYAVYSAHLNGLAPFLKDYDVYLYCTDSNVVVVCLDCCGRSEEQTYKESETLGPLIMADGCEPRVSVVWKLAETVRHIEETLQDTTPDIHVFGVLLTEADIINACELLSLWDDHNIMVFDYLSRLKYRKIMVSNHANDDLACKRYVNTIMEATLDTSMSEKTVAETQAKCEDTHGETELEYDVDELKEEDSDNSEEECDTEAEDEETSSTDDALFPDGVVEQNNNISVKVEILRPIPNPREELDKLVGCADIKRRMDELVALTSYNRMMQDAFPNGKKHDVSLHSVFLGRPGTGKTTVCKIFGSLLRQAGALSKGHVVVCNRGTFLGTLWGDEERSVRQVVAMAQGGVLMIDEAYLLNGKHDHDPGKLVIQLLMNILADETQRDIAVVLCGYKEPMMRLLDSNPGLYSRFPNKFEFTDFTVDELLEITRRRIKDYDYTFTVQAWEKYSKMLAQAHQMRDPETWGNARFVANQLERIYIQHATRCVRQSPMDKQDLLKIIPDDILPLEIPRQKTKIGF